MAESSVPEVSTAHETLFIRSSAMPADAVEVRGYDFNAGVDHSALLRSYATTGFQATSFGQAIEEVNRMVSVCFDISCFVFLAPP
jgi:deoxyhypusine synthase